MPTTGAKSTLSPHMVPKAFPESSSAYVKHGSHLTVPFFINHREAMWLCDYLKSGWSESRPKAMWLSMPIPTSPNQCMHAIFFSCDNGLIKHNWYNKYKVWVFLTWRVLSSYTFCLSSLIPTVIQLSNKDPQHKMPDCIGECASQRFDHTDYIGVSMHLII